MRVASAWFRPVIRWRGVLVVAALLAACAGKTEANPDDAPDVLTPGDVPRDVSTVDAGSDTGPLWPFVEYPWSDHVPDPQTERLCVESADPDSATDTLFIDCASEGAAFAPADLPGTDQLVVMVYNAERGHHLDEQVALLRDDPAVPMPDVLLLSEADRGCPRTDHRNVTRELAEALGMNYVYAVEFVELLRQGDPPVTVESCEHGNALLSRYPIGNVEVIRHASQYSWYYAPGESAGHGQPRLGGRVAIAADVAVGERLIRFYSVHFESIVTEPWSADQAAELVTHAASVPLSVIIGGDMNAPAYWWDLQQGTSDDPTVAPLFAGGYVDAHAPLAYEDRITHPPSLVLDLIFGRDATFAEPAVCPEETCGDLSDHLPVWVQLGI